jgi:Domain of unknown function (DUF6249)
MEETMKVRFGLCAAIAALALSMLCTAASASLAQGVPEGVSAAVVDSRAHDGIGQSEALVAILVPLGSVGAFVMLVCAGFYASYRRDQIRHQTIRAVLERGGEIPSELLRPPAPPRTDLRRGILLIATGGGLMIVLRALVPEPRLWTAGLVPVLLGLGYLLVWKIEPPAAASGARAGGDRIE